jgi:hypothetical protein
LCFAIACYVYDSIPLGMFVAAIISGIFDFLGRAWYWRHPKRIKLYCFLIPQIILLHIACDITGVIGENDNGIFSLGFWHIIVFYLSLIGCTSLLLIVIFKNALTRYLEGKTNRDSCICSVIR